MQTEATILHRKHPLPQGNAGCPRPAGGDDSRRPLARRRFRPATLAVNPPPCGALALPAPRPTACPAGHDAAKGESQVQPPLRSSPALLAGQSDNRLACW